MYLKSITTLILLSTLSLFAETVGDASWYGKKFQGKPTASGEAFDMYAYTAAHRTLAFGTKLKVTNLSNNKSIEVRINDRGPFKENRIVDLSYQAAKEIGILQEGIAEVSIEEIKSANGLSKVTTENKIDKKSNPYLTDSEIKSMKKYAETTIETQTYSSKDEYSNDEYSSDVKNESIIKLQIAAFSTNENAENFVREEKANEFKMQVAEVYSSTANKTLYKVVILCDSNKEASDIISSKQYKGAYLFHQ